MGVLNLICCGAETGAPGVPQDLIAVVTVPAVVLPVQLIVEPVVPLTPAPVPSAAVVLAVPLRVLPAELIVEFLVPFASAAVPATIPVVPAIAVVPAVIISVPATVPVAAILDLAAVTIAPVAAGQPRFPAVAIGYARRKYDCAEEKKD